VVMAQVIIEEVKGTHMVAAHFPVKRPTLTILAIMMLSMIGIVFADSTMDEEPSTIAGKWRVLKVIYHAVDRKLLQPVGDDVETADELGVEWIEFQHDGRGRLSTGFSLRYRIDKAKNPRVLILTVQLQPNKQLTIPCIYELAADTLKLGWCFHEHTTPKSFDYWKEEDCMFLILKRVR